MSAALSNTHQWHTATVLAKRTVHDGISFGKAADVQRP